MKILGYGLLALGALALLSAVLLPAEFDYQDTYDGAGASRRLMLGIFGGVVFIGGTILVAAQSILDGLRRPGAPSIATPMPGKALDRPTPTDSTGVRRDPSGGNALLISAAVIVALIAVLAVVGMANLIMRQQRDADSSDEAVIEANIAADALSDGSDSNQAWPTRNEWEELERAPDRAPVEPGLDKVVPGLDRLPVRRTDPEPEPGAEAPEAAQREAPARRVAPATRDDPFADPPTATDDPFAD